MLDNKKNDILRVLSISDADYETVAYELYHLIFISTQAEQQQELFRFFCQQFDRMDAPIENHGYVLCAPANLEHDELLEEQDQIDYIRTLLEVVNKFPLEKFNDAIDYVYEYIKKIPSGLKFTHFLIFTQSGFFPYGKGYLPILQVEENLQNQFLPICESFDHLLWIQFGNPNAMINLTMAIMDKHPGEENKLIRREMLDILTQKFMEIGAMEATIANNSEGPSGKFQQGLDYFAEGAVIKGQRN